MVYVVAWQLSQAVGGQRYPAVFLPQDSWSQQGSNHPFPSAEGLFCLAVWQACLASQDASLQQL